MTAPVLLLPPDPSDESVRLWRAASAAGWSVVRAQGWRAPAGLPTAKLVIYGGELFARAMQEQLGRWPAPLPDPSWLCDLPTPLRRREITLTRPPHCLSAQQFVKPVHDKWFPAGVYPPGHTFSDSPDDTDDAIYVAEVVSWRTEWRLFVADGTITAACRYAVGGQPADDDPSGAAAAVAFGEAVLSAAGDALPAGAVLDVGEIDGRGWAVVELNPAAESALYHAPAAAILPVLCAAYGVEP